MTAEGTNLAPPEDPSIHDYDPTHPRGNKELAEHMAHAEKDYVEGEMSHSRYAKNLRAAADRDIKDAKELNHLFNPIDWVGKRVLTNRAKDYGEMAEEHETLAKHNGRIANSAAREAAQEYDREKAAAERVLQDRKELAGEMSSPEPDPLAEYDE